MKTLLLILLLAFCASAQSVSSSIGGVVGSSPGIKGAGVFNHIEIGFEKVSVENLIEISTGSKANTKGQVNVSNHLKLHFRVGKSKFDVFPMVRLSGYRNDKYSKFGVGFGVGARVNLKRTEIYGFATAPDTSVDRTSLIGGGVTRRDKRLCVFFEAGAMLSNNGRQPFARFGLGYQFANREK